MQPRKHSLDLVIVVSLFFVYAACALLLCVIGANVYRNTAMTMQENFDQRTSVLYVVEKIRQNDIEGCIRVESLGEVDALVLVEKQSGRDYETWLFVRDQMLYEGLFAPGSTIDIKLCQPVMPMEALTLESPGSNTGRVNATFRMLDGKTSSITLLLRSGQRGA
ncbi:MAG: DUF4860 domain-containing protein [Coriobacteriales bacterium]|jgi:hypothetical protein|nr:DUF4860 domain-containing protein [Coriobacteriales bacterium]